VIDVDRLEAMLTELTAPMYTWRMSRAQKGTTRSLPHSIAMHKQYDNALSRIDEIVRRYAES